MKNLISFFISLIFISLQSCSKEETEQTFEVSGQILSTTNVGIPNIVIEVTTSKVVSGIIFGGGLLDLEKITIKTDQDGNFKTDMRLTDVTIVNIFRLPDNNLTLINKTLPIKNSTYINVIVERFEILKIIVKNVNPFSQNDRIEFNEPSPFLVKRENFGNQNEPQVFNQGVGSPENAWLGINVHSEITYRVNESYQNNMRISTRKNGIWSTIPKTPIIIVPNQINEYYINY